MEKSSQIIRQLNVPKGHNLLENLGMQITGLTSEISVTISRLFCILPQTTRYTLNQINHKFPTGTEVLPRTLTRTGVKLIVVSLVKTQLL